MKWKEYKYTGQFSQLKGGVIYRPMIDLKLILGTNVYSCFALIDSGTDSTLINAEFAEMLGIDESKCKRIKVSGVESLNATGFGANIKFKIEGFEEEFTTEVVFVKNMVTAGLLGQKDIFENFKIRFEKRNNKFYLAKEI